MQSHTEIRTLPFEQQLAAKGCERGRGLIHSAAAEINACASPEQRREAMGVLKQLQRRVMSEGRVLVRRAVA